MLTSWLMAGFIYGIIALFCAAVALAVVMMSDNKRPEDKDVIAASNIIECPLCSELIKIREDEAAFYFEAAMTKCKCGFSLYVTDYNYGWAAEGLRKEIKEIREREHLKNGVLNG